MGCRTLGREGNTPEYRTQFPTPEDINDSPDTAPSRRVLNVFERYQKPLMGVLAVEAIGLDTLRRDCPLFSAWIGKLEGRARS